MSKAKAKRLSRLLKSVKDLLFDEWDPIGVNEYIVTRDEYDTYACSLCTLLAQGADECKLIQALGRYQRESMGLSQIDEERNQRVARKLLLLVEPLRS